MSICAGKLDRKITLERYTQEKKGGVPSASWLPIATVSASKEELRGYERFQNDRNLSDSEVEFCIRWSSQVKDLKPKDRIILGDTKYDIVSVQEIGRREGLAIKAKRKDVSNNG